MEHLCRERCLADLYPYTPPAARQAKAEPPALGPPNAFTKIEGEPLDCNYVSRGLWLSLVSAPNPRRRHCAYLPHAEQTFRPLARLLPERTSPELRYLETKWAAHISYDSTVNLLHDVLPIDTKHSAV